LAQLIFKRIAQDHAHGHGKAPRACHGLINPVTPVTCPPSCLNTGEWGAGAGTVTPVTVDVTPVT
jgi:hypothetical protein